MEPGFRSFDPVEKGQVLAHDRHGDLRAHEDGRILLPLYQHQGLDGYFLVRPVHLFWLKIASALRILKLDRFVRWLPGVSRHESDEHSIVVDPSVARWYTVQIFHLLGFRRRQSKAEMLVFTRRWTARAGRRLRA